MTDSLLACPLPSRGIIAVGGEDRHAFLQGLISNDIFLCTQGHPIYAALLTPQGKFLHDMFILDHQGQFLIDCEAARAEDLIRRLTAYRLRSKVTIENRADSFDIWALWCADDESDASPAPDPLTYRDPRLPELGFRCLVAKGIKPGSGQSIDFSAYDRHRIGLGVPDGSRDLIVGSSTLQEGNLDRLNAISWTKGCYVGQELTARIHYRGLVKRRLQPIIIPANDTTADAADLRSRCGDIGLALMPVESAG